MTEHRTSQEGAPYIRFVEIDVLRGFTVLGIFWVNIFVFALPSVLEPLPFGLQDDSPINTYVWLFGDIYVEGTMRALFSMLFGASALIFLDEARLASNGLELVDRYYRRSLLLILFGLVHAWILLWPLDVLYAYGLFGLFLFPLRKLSARTLLICGIVLLVLGDLEITTPSPIAGDLASLANIDIQELDEDWILPDTAEPENTNASPPLPDIAPEPWEADIPPEQAIIDDSSTSELIQKTIAIYRGDYATIFNSQREDVVENQSLRVYQEYVFDIGGMMLIGMALLKLGVLTGKRSRRVYVVIALLGYALGSIVRALGTLEGLDTGAGISWTTLYNTGRLLMAFGHIGLIGLLCTYVQVKPLTATLAVVGRMALTNYIMQTLIAVFLFYGVGLALYAQLERYQIALVCVCIWMFQITYCKLWLIRYRQGPLEWLWRSLIYAKKLPNRKTERTTIT